MDVNLNVYTRVIKIILLLNKATAKCLESQSIAVFISRTLNIRYLPMICNINRLNINEVRTNYSCIIHVHFMKDTRCMFKFSILF